MYYCADVQAQAYNESWDVVPGAVRVKGWGFVNNDIFGFLLKACASITEEVCFITRAPQVRVNKLTGTGEEILQNEYVYATSVSNFQTVTAHPTGTIGTDYYFVGKAKKAASASDKTVLIKFWGDEYNHADRAA